ncbi:MAG: extracellular solute-binding protein [Pseudonocardiaceae bacterium]
MKTRRGTLPLPLLAVLTVAALVAAGCGAKASATGSGETITLYNAQHQQTTDALIAAFTAQTGIKVNVRSDGEDVLTAQIEQEGAKSPADVFYTENSPWLEQLDRKHLLAKVDPATLQQVPAADSGASGDWVGVSARVSALIYNTDGLTHSQLPTSVLDLADPRWKGKLDLAPSETDFWPIVSSVAKTYGQARALAWLRALKANAGSNANTPSNETVTSDVSQGSSQLAVINGYYFYRLRAEVGKSAVHAALAYFAPHDPGYALNVSGAAVLTSSKHQAAAQKLLAFLTSTTGQTILAHSDSFEYPIGDHVAANPALRPFDQLRPNSFSVAELGTGEDAKTLLQQAQLI